MADEHSILPDSIRKIPEMQALDLLFAARLKAVEIERILIYLVDTAPASVLPYLADQFGIIDSPGWSNADNEEQKRQLIKNGINLNRKKGTVYAIKESMISVGYGEAQLREGIGGHWATFDVHVDLGETKGLEGNEAISKLTRLINEYKNVRSHLLGITFTSNVFDEFLDYTDDTFEFTEEYNNQVDDNTILESNYDGSFKFDGSRKFDDINDTLEF